MAIAETDGRRCVIGMGLKVKVAAKLNLAASSVVREASEFSEIFLHGILLESPYEKSF